MQGHVSRAAAEPRDIRIPGIARARAVRGRRRLLVSNWPRASSSVISSIAPNWPKPALLTTTSSEP
ncbi:hypothetical protein, partial [Clavibacter michiganensis]|uniref:hypothetical protein n=1 Tax=Clavibacter michiganensis TaxID=28447 RepID=UPI00292E1697